MKFVVFMLIGQSYFNIYLFFKRKRKTIIFNFFPSFIISTWIVFSAVVEQNIVVFNVVAQFVMYVLQLVLMIHLVIVKKRI